MPANIKTALQEARVKLKDQVAIITGAGRNIGAETAKLLAAEGARIAVVDMDRGRADKVTGDIRAAGGDAGGFVADVSDEAAVEKLVADLIDLPEALTQKMKAVYGPD